MTKTSFRLSDAREVAEMIAIIEILEAATYRSKVKSIINRAREIIDEAVATYKRSRASSSARLNFRSRISGIIRRNASTVASYGWQSGGGEEGKKPPGRRRDWMRHQQRQLSNWFLQIKADPDGKLPGGVGRGMLYAKSLEGLFNEYRGLALQATKDAPAMPAVPRDGTTNCYQNCQCHWQGPERFEEKDGVVWKAWWKITPAEHCDTCLCRAQHWDPLTFRRVQGQWQPEVSNGPAQCNLFRPGSVG